MPSGSRDDGSAGVIVLLYDRRVEPELLDVLKPGGWARSLVEYGRSGQFALDLQLRGTPKSKACHATLYVGLTKVLDLSWSPSNGFSISAHPTWKQRGKWDERWDGARKRRFSADDWRGVEDYVERAIIAVGPKYLKEGAVQSALSGFRTQDQTVVDREVVVGFSSTSEKQRISSAVARPLLNALRLDRAPAWWKTAPTSLGGECDGLALDRDGSLMAIEVKPRRATGGITWSAVQVRHYATLLARWARECSDASMIIDGMVAQRVELGLADPTRATVQRPIVVRPVLAIERGASPAALDRLRQVHDHLRNAGLDDPPLEIYSVNLVGRLDRLDI